MEGHAPRVDVGVARRARDIARGRRAWVFASPAPHARLRVTEAHGGELTAEAEGLALRVAGMAINVELPVIVLADCAAAFYGVPVPFADGRVGAVVVAGAHGLEARPDVAERLRDLVSAEVPALGRVGAR